MRPLPQRIKLEDSQRQVLEQWVRAHSTPQQVVKRCEIILQSAEGKSDKAIARQLGINRHTCRLWRERFVGSGLDSLWEIEPGRGRKVQLGLAQRIIEATLHTKPKGQTHWSTRELAKEQGVHPSTVARIWQEHELKPHRQKNFKLSRDGKFVQKLLDVVGIYLNPPQHAVVLCVDEKSQIQALDRTQPGLPLKKGRCGTMTHDYKRHGTATLFAALNAADGRVISMCDDRHRHQEWLQFLRVIDSIIPPDKQLHLIADNYATHKHRKVQRWLAKHPRFHVHFTPTSSSWLNMVERFFRDLTDKRIRRGVFRDVEELIMAIGDYIDQHNRSPKPFIWTAKASDILEKVKRARKALDNLHSA